MASGTDFIWQSEVSFLKTKLHLMTMSTGGKSSRGMADSGKLDLAPGSYFTRQKAEPPLGRVSLFVLYSTCE